MRYAPPYASLVPGCLSLWLLTGLSIFSVPTSARADAVRFRFAVDAEGGLQQVAAGPQGAIGELVRGFGMQPLPFQRMFRPNQMVTFRHPHHGRNVTVPLTLPDYVPRIAYRGDSIVYNYGSYWVEIRFLADGGVDVVYNSGPFRPLLVQ